MKEDNVVQTKSYAFAVKIVRLYKHLVEEKKEYTLSKQLLRSGTSIGANVEEAVGGQSRKDFYSKMTVAYKEARETKYWLRLLTDTGFVDAERNTELIGDCEELLNILGSIRRTMANKGM